MFRFMGALALVVSCGLFAQVQAKVPPYEYVMPPFIVEATPLLPPRSPAHAAAGSFTLPVCQPDTCDSNVLCQATSCRSC